MDNRAEVREFLASRRARIAPDQAGLPAYGGNRRVKGLRREEVALLAGVSIDYYVRMERGNRSAARYPAGARCDHRRTDVGTQCSSRHSRHEPTGTRAVLAGAVVAARRPDCQAARQHDALHVPRPRGTRLLRRIRPHGRRRRRNVRLEAGRNPHDNPLITLVGELSTQSELFRQHWASHNVKFHRSGRKRLRHPAVGELDLNFEAMELPSDSNLRINIYTADPNTPSADGLKLLATWAATEAALPEPIATSDKR